MTKVVSINISFTKIEGGRESLLKSPSLYTNLSIIFLCQIQCVYWASIVQYKPIKLVDSSLGDEDMKGDGKSVCVCVWEREREIMEEMF